MTLIEGRFLRSACAGRCGAVVVTIPRYLGAGLCGACWPAPVHPRPYTGPRGASNPGLVVDDRERVMAAARAKVAERAPVLRVAGRAPVASDGLPPAFWEVARQPDAIARIGCWDVWRIASEKDDRAAGYRPQWRAAVAVPQVGDFWSVSTWICWEGSAERWAKLPVQVRRRPS